MVVILAISFASLITPRQVAAQQSVTTGGLLSVEGYEELLAGKGESAAQALFQPYMLGLLAGFEWTIKDQRERGVDLRFCPPADMVFSVAELHATIQAGVRSDPRFYAAKSERAVGWAAFTGYQQRFPCPAGVSSAAPGKQTANDILSIAEFTAQYKRWWRYIILQSPLKVLAGFAWGFRDGVDGMQHLIPDRICVPRQGTDVYGEIIAGIRDELEARPDYWADKQDESIGQVAIIVVKKRYACTK